MLDRSEIYCIPPLIKCPYCNDGEFVTEDPLPKSARGSQLEILALPYARDVDIFDPPHNKRSSNWSLIGGDFYKTLNWDRFVGILRAEEGVKIYYCVARCPSCNGLADIFANCSAQTKKLSEIWPQLLTTDNGQQKLFSPHNPISRASASTLSLALWLVFLYFVSIIPLYFDPAAPTFAELAKRYSGVLSARTIMTVALFCLLLLRQKCIRTFQDKDAFKRLLKLRDERGLYYWLNYAISRFTGYQRQGRPITLNGVVLLGGIPSLTALVAAWTLAQSGILDGKPSQSLYAACFELAFWAIVAYCTGIAVYNLSIIPHYILRQLRNIPLNLDILYDRFENTRIIDQIGLYAGLGIYILLLCILSLSALPILIPRFEELEWVTFWTQLALILWYSFVVIRFQGKGHSTLQLRVVLPPSMLVASYFLFRYGMTTQACELFRIRACTDLKHAFAFAVSFGLSLSILSLIAIAKFYRNQRYKKTYKAGDAVNFKEKVR